mgnify:CR=1 FL=1
MGKRTFETVVKFVSAIVLTAGMDIHAAPYHVHPGDLLQVNVWNEEALSGQVLVRPDGFISVPLAGEIDTSNHTIAEVSENIAAALSSYMKDAPMVVVALVEARGYKLYVLGKVQRPGQYLINGETDIMQALALAGGLSTFAARTDIIVLRRGADGAKTSIPFEYSEVEEGDDLETNIVLESGDVIVVP